MQLSSTSYGKPEVFLKYFTLPNDGFSKEPHHVAMQYREIYKRSFG